MVAMALPWSFSLAELDEDFNIPKGWRMQVLHPLVFVAQELPNCLHIHTVVDMTDNSQDRITMDV